MKTRTSPSASKPRLLVLASTSRYRKALLERLEIPFVTASPGVDETPLANELPAETAIRLSEAKARAVAQAYPDALIIGSDQVANFANKAVGKPRDRDDAMQQLKAMRGRTIVFHTGLALLNAATGECQVALVDVVSTFRTSDDATLEAYLDREQPFDCAASVKSEALGIALFTRIASDDPTALIGLPLIRLTDMLIAQGLHPL